jgi:hypothetical protein
MSVVNNEGNVYQVSVQSLSLVLSDKGAEAVGHFIREALEKPGIDRVELLSDLQGPESVTRAESRYFVPVSPGERITDSTVPMALILEAPVFKDGDKWRFFDGQQSFLANIEDTSFLDRVNRGERFGKGDILRVDMRITQEQTGLKLSAERTVVKVREHKVATFQKSIPTPV